MNMLTYKKTKDKIKFLEISIGDTFYAHDTFWVKISRNAAKDLKPDGYNCCSFTLDKEDEFVNKVEMSLT